MNSLFLLIAAVVTFIFGYLYFSKFLSTTVFGLNLDYSTVSDNAMADTAGRRTHRYLLIGQHFAYVASTTTLVGTALAVYWGWIPAFLWVVVGTTLAAGFYGIGSLWLAARHPRQSLNELIRHYLPDSVRLAASALIVIILFVFSALLVLLSARLLVNHPSVVVVFWLYLLFASILGIIVHKRSVITVVPASAILLILTLAAIWLLGKSSIGFSGALNFDIAGGTALTLDKTAAWVALLLIYGFYAQRPFMAKLLPARAWSSASLMVLVLIIFLIGLLVSHPVLVAPGFNTDIKSISVLPWLFATLTGGALSGGYLLFAKEMTAPALDREIDVRAVGYGAALLEGLLALSAIIICTAGFATASEWKDFYINWATLQDPSYLLELYINGMVFFTDSIGLNTDFATNLIALTLLALSMTTLEATLRILNKMIRKSPGVSAVAFFRSENWPFILALVVIAIIALATHTGGFSSLPPLFGIANQMLAALGLILLALALRQRQRPSDWVVAMAAIILMLSLWATVSQTTLWWSRGSWGLCAAGLLLLVIGSLLLVKTLLIFIGLSQDSSSI